MQPKFVVGTLIFLNLLFLAVFFLATQTSLFDLWLTQKVLPHVCITQSAGGADQLAFCE